MHLEPLPKNRTHSNTRLRSAQQPTSRLMPGEYPSRPDCCCPDPRPVSRLSQPWGLRGRPWGALAELGVVGVACWVCWELRPCCWAAKISCRCQGDISLHLIDLRWCRSQVVRVLCC